MSSLDARLERYIATRDKRIAKFWPHSPAHLREKFDELLERGRIVFGGRSSCGGSDPTMTVLSLWDEVVRKARTLGYQISEEPVRQQRNAWATRSGGFWNESEYRLVATTEESSVVGEAA